MSSAYSSLDDRVLFHCAQFTVPRFTCVYVCVFCVYFFHTAYVLYYCKSVGWTWWYRSLILRTYLPSVLWHCSWLGHLTRINPSPCLVRREKKNRIDSWLSTPKISSQAKQCGNYSDRLTFDRNKSPRIYEPPCSSNYWILLHSKNDWHNWSDIYDAYKCKWVSKSICLAQKSNVTMRR